MTVGSYWRLPERLYDDPDELAGWARAALAAAQRAALSKAGKAKRKPPARNKLSATKIARPTPAKQRKVAERTPPG